MVVLHRFIPRSTVRSGSSGQCPRMTKAWGALRQISTVCDWHRPLRDGTLIRNVRPKMAGAVRIGSHHQRRFEFLAQDRESGVGAGFAVRGDAVDGRPSHHDGARPERRGLGPRSCRAVCRRPDRHRRGQQPHRPRPEAPRSPRGCRRQDALDHQLPRPPPAQPFRLGPPGGRVHLAVHELDHRGSRLRRSGLDEIGDAGSAGHGQPGGPAGTISSGFVGQLDQDDVASRGWQRLKQRTMAAVAVLNRSFEQSPNHAA